MNRLASASVALAAILVGILSLFGVRPMNSRATDIVLGTASLALGVALLLMTGRRRISMSAHPQR
jgi:ascorbate-specific PTS system EIIC-type component UlaA